MPAPFSVRPHASVWFVCLLLVVLIGSGGEAQASHAGTIGGPEHTLVRNPNVPEAPPPNTPGAQDPQGAPETYMMFRDDELFYPVVYDTGDNWQLKYYFDYPDATLGITQSLGSGYEGTDWQIYAKRGRVTRQDKDQVVWVSRSGTSSTGYVLLIDDGLNVENITEFSGLAPRANGFADFIGVAAGDLDKIPDNAGANHDEVVVAFASPSANGGYAITLRALNVTNAPYDSTTCETTATTSIGVDSLNGIVPVDNLLDVAIADFDGDGMNEIAVTHLKDANNLVVTTFDYTFDGNTTCTLTEANESVPTVYNVPAPGNILGSLQTDVGDIDGDEIADLVIVSALTSDNSVNPVPYGLWFSGKRLGDKSLQMVLQGESQFNSVGTAALRVQVATGLFLLDPGTGYDFNRRQVLVGWTSGDDTITIQAFDWNPTPGFENWRPISTRVDFSPYYTDLRWSIATGAFKGMLAPDDPRWSVAFYGRNSQQPSPGGSYFLYDLANPDAKKQRDTATVQNADSRLPIVAADNDGNSLFLGAPVHIIADGTLTTDYVIYEPPKHAFYNIDQSKKWGFNGEVVNLSRYSDFNVTFATNNTSSVNTTATQSTDWTIGGSNSSSASGTVKAGFDIGLAATEVKSSVGLSETVSYNHNQRNEHINSTYETNSVQYSTTTSADDSVGGSTQNLDIWRYRVYGLPSGATGANASGYYDFVIPAKKVDFIGNSGLDLDWYQPLHENGNLLSYPLANNNTFTPSDVGNIMVGGTVVSGTLVPASQITCCGNGGFEELQFSGSVSQGSQFSSSNTWNESVDFTASYSAKVQAFGDGAKVAASTDLNFNNSNSWSNTHNQNKTTTVSQAITLNYAQDTTGFGYFVYPVMHTTPDGTFKVSHAVQFLPNSQTSFWDDYYGHKPDPALNLPLRFYETTFSNNPTWAPTTDSSRKSIRGFQLLNGTKNPRTNQNDALPLRAVTAGEPLLLQVNLYNYSTGGITNQTPTNADNLEVLFQYAPTNGNQETGPRVNIGTISVPQVAPMQIVPAQIAWNTTGLGGEGECITQQYRVIVTLDPNNTIDEIYEAEDPNIKYPYVVVDPLNNQPTTTYLEGIDPGQNNQGFAYATIQTPDPNGNCAPGHASDGFLKLTQSLGAVDAGDNKVHTDSVTALKNRPLRLRLKVFSEKWHGLYNRVLIYDGNPRDGAPLIADKHVHGGSPKGALVWFNWTPRTGGLHTLYAKLVQRGHDPVKNNARAILEVDVVKKIK